MNVTALDPNTLAASLQRAHADATTTSSSTSSSSSTAASTAGSDTLGSSDFLTLLVSELKNQDPTQPTDPTQYITQLAQVNSLEQLIDINTQLTSLGGSTISKTTTTSNG